MYGMDKTTVYLPDELKAALTRLALQQGRSQADIIRRAVAQAVARPAPEFGFLDEAPIAERVDEHLSGFGER